MESKLLMIEENNKNVWNIAKETAHKTIDCFKQRVIEYQRGEFTDRDDLSGLNFWEMVVICCFETDNLPMIRYIDNQYPIDKSVWNKGYKSNEKIIEYINDKIHNSFFV